MSDAIDVRVPGDKSITHRALILAGMAEGESRLEGLLDAADTRSTAAILRALGVAVPEGPLGTTTVRGVGLGGFRPPAAALECGNSGTSARLFLGALAGCDLEATLTGDSSLRGRPMRRVTAPLEAVGARFVEEGEPDRLPIRVIGTSELDAIDMVNERSSAQVKTAMILAGLNAGENVRVTETGRPRDHTERILGAMGVSIRTSATEEGEAVSVEPADALSPLEMKVPGDISSAAFFLALGALRYPVRALSVGTNPTRTGVLGVLERMGAEALVEPVGHEAGEPMGDVRVSADGLRATTVGADEIPTLLDEIPILAVVAARAEGATRFEGVAELRVKETDRITALARNFEAIGVEVEEYDDALVVHGSDRPLQGTVTAFGDHRIAMAFGVLGALPDCDIRVEGEDVVGISYPGFWDELIRIARAIETR